MKNYYIKASLMFLFGNPIALFITTIAIIMTFAGSMLPDIIAIPLLLLSFIGLLSIVMYKFWTIALEATIPTKATKILLPVFSMYCFQICVAIIDVREPRFFFAYFLYLIPVGLFFFMRDELIFLIMPIVINAMTVLSVLVLVVAFKRTKRNIIYDKIIIIYILVFASLASLSSHVSFVALSNRSTVINSFAGAGLKLDRHLRDQYDIDLAVGILKVENELSFWSTRFPSLSSDDILPEFTTYRVEALVDNGFEKTSECISIYISCRFLDVIKNPVITGIYEDKLYFLNPLGEGEKYTDIRRIVRSYDNRTDTSEFIEKEIRGTSIYVANGLCYLDEYSQLPQTFDYYEFINNYFSSGMWAFGIIESSNLPVRYEAVRHDYFDYAFILNFDLSGIDTADFYCFLGFKKLETKIPFYPWKNYDSLEDIYLNIQYFNYQYFFVSPSYDFLGTKSLYDSPFPYNVDKLAIENLISSIAIESWE